MFSLARLRSPIPSLFRASRALLVLCCCVGVTGCRMRVGGEVSPKEKPLVVLVLGDLRGMLEPCGCASHPRGGLYRVGTLASRWRAASAAMTVVSAGDLLFDAERPAAERAAQELAKAEVLVEGLRRIGLWASARGELDSADGRAPLARPWKSLEPGTSALGELGGVRVAAVAGSPAHPGAARQALAAVRRQGAQVVILLSRGDRAQTKALVEAAPGADFAVVGKLSEALPVAVRVGRTVVLEVGGQGEHVGVLELRLPSPGQPIVDGEPGRDALQVASLRVAQARRRLNLARKEQDAPAVAFFGVALEQALVQESRANERLAAELPHGKNYFRFRLVELDKRIGDEPGLLALRDAYKARLRELNEKDAGRFQAPPAPAGVATYRGTASCGGCHGDALRFWKGTQHGRAWATLVKDQSDFDLSCVSCHVTGYLRPGGASLTQRPELHDVGCEACHGPGSLHEDAPAARKKALVRREVQADTCLGCHTKEHSDLFEFSRYRARILGPGHGRPVAAPGGGRGSP